MGRKRIKKLVQMIFNVDDKVFIIPIKKNLNEEDKRKIDDINIEINKINQKKKGDSGSRKNNNTPQLDTIFNFDDLDSDEDQYDFFNEDFFDSNHNEKM